MSFVISEYDVCLTLYLLFCCYSYRTVCNIMIENALTRPHLSHLPLDIMVAIVQTIFLDAFS